MTVSSLCNNCDWYFAVSVRTPISPWVWTMSCCCAKHRTCARVVESALRNVSPCAAAATNAGEIRVDPLQRLHTLQNLAWLLGPSGDGVPSVPRTLRDGNLQARCSVSLAVTCVITSVQLGLVNGLRCVIRDFDCDSMLVTAWWLHYMHAVTAKINASL